MSLCKRNHQLDEINQKNKNIYELAKKRRKHKTQRCMLNNEIKELKDKTDTTINESQNTLCNIEKLQCSRKSAGEFFNPVGNIFTQHLDASCIDKSRVHSPAIIHREPHTALTRL
jgi:acetyl-CoA carboxylase alpha subunit